MATLTLTRVCEKKLGPLDLSLTTGLYAVLSRSEPDLALLVELLSGLRRPRRGAILLGPEPSFGVHAQRARVAALLEDEDPLPAPTVRHGLAEIGELGGLPDDPDQLLGRFGATELGRRRPQHLSPLERRVVGLCLALAPGDRSLITLYDPLGLCPPLDRPRILEACRRAAESAIVVLTTTSLQDAVALGGRTLLLDHGRLSTPGVLKGAAAAPFRLWVRSPDARRFAALLPSSSAVTGVAFDEAHGSSQLEVRGPALEPLANAVVETALAHELVVDELVPQVPSLTQVFGEPR